MLLLLLQLLAADVGDDNRDEDDRVCRLTTDCQLRLIMPFSTDDAI